MGSGPPILFVHGTAADHSRWASISPVFETHFSVHTIDRRGRGDSGDVGPYAMEREFEDVAAVVESFGEPVNLVGHSFGAICSLEASLRTKNIRKMVLYEPPIPTGLPIYPPGTAARIQGLFDAGDRDAAVATFFREIVRMPAHEMDLMRSLPLWKARVAAAHTIGREMVLGEQYRFASERWSRMNVPTLLLLGGDSPPFFKKAVELVHSALPDSRMVVLPGQQHVAMNTAAELFTSTLLTFLSH